MADDDEVNLSSDEEFEVSNAKKRKAKASSSTQEPAKKKKKTAAAKKAGRKRAKYYDDSDDDFDDEPESESDYGSEEEAEGMDVDTSGLPDISSDEAEDSFDEDLYRDDEDRIALGRLTDMEKQAILYERGEKRNQIRERNSLKAQLRAARGISAPSKAAAAAGATKSRARAKVAAAPAVSPAKSAASSKKAALNAIKAKRMASADEAAEAAKARKARKASDDADSDYGSDTERGIAPAKSKPQPAARKMSAAQEAKLKRLKDRHRVDSDEEDSGEVVYDAKGRRIMLNNEVEFEDIQKMMVKRDDLVKWLDASHWETTVKGAFVRVSIGPNAAGDAQYRLAEVIDFNPEGKSFTLPVDKSGRPRQCTMSLHLAIGGNSRDFTMDLVSNQPITAEEFQDWVLAVKSQELALPSKKTSLQVAKNLHTARTSVRTEADIEREIAKRTLEQQSMEHVQQDRSSQNRHADMVSNINKRNRGVNTTVEAAYAPEAAGDSALNPFARRATSTSVSTKRTTAAPPAASTSAPTAASSTQDTYSSSNGAHRVALPLSLDLDESPLPATRSSQSQHQSHSSSHYGGSSNQRQGNQSHYGHHGHNRGGVQDPQAIGKPAHVVSLAQYFNRR